MVKFPGSVCPLSSRVPTSAHAHRPPTHPHLPVLIPAPFHPPTCARQVTALREFEHQGVDGLGPGALEHGLSQEIDMHLASEDSEAIVLREPSPSVVAEPSPADPIDYTIDFGAEGCSLESFMAGFCSLAASSQAALEPTLAPYGRLGYSVSADALAPPPGSVRTYIRKHYR